MEISKSELIGLRACRDGLDRFKLQTGNTADPVEVSSLIGGHNTYSDLLWLADKTLPKDRIARFACDCALINIEMIKPYTDQYELIIDFLNSPSNADADAVYAVYYAASSHAAVRAVYYAVYYAAAADAMSAAAAAVDAADAGSKEKVDDLLRELFA